MQTRATVTRKMCVRYRMGFRAQSETAETKGAAERTPRSVFFFSFTGGLEKKKRMNKSARPFLPYFRSR